MVKLASYLNIRCSTLAGKSWSEKEVELLKHHYPRIGGKVIAFLSDRTKWAIQAKATYLGIKYFKTPIRWRHEEDEFIQKNWPKMSVEEIAGKLLRRTDHAIRNRMSKLGIQKRRVYHAHPMELASISDFELGWLVAIIEGEGSISIIKLVAHHRPQYTPNVYFCNSDEGIIDAGVRIIRKLYSNADYKFKEPKFKNEDTFQNKIRGKQYWYVRVWGISRVLPLLELIKPRLVSRKRQVAQLVIKWCRSRIKHRAKPYSEDELAIIKRIRQIQGSRKG